MLHDSPHNHIFENGIIAPRWLFLADGTAKMEYTSGTGTLAVTATAVTFSGTVTLAADPTADLQAATKQYVDQQARGERRNFIDNGAMLLCQLSGGVSIPMTGPQSAWGTDRWRSTVGQAPAVIAVVRNGSSGLDEFPWYLRHTVTTADASIAAGDLYYFKQGIEAFGNFFGACFGTASAKTITLSFWVRSSLTGSFSGSFRKYNSTFRSYPFSYTINAANTWEKKTVTIPGDTNSAWATDGDGLLLFDLGCGTTYRSTAGSWSTGNYLGVTGAVNLVSTVNATWDLTGVQLEIGSYATPFEHVSITTLIERCYRYMFIEVDPPYRGVASGASCSRMANKFPVPMRIAPTVTYTGTPAVWDGGVTTTVTAITTSWTSTTRHEFDGSTAAAMTTGRACAMYSNASACTFIYDAELG